MCKCDDMSYHNDLDSWHAMQMEPEISLYDTLEVSPRASASVIKAAYRCLAQSNHPDKNAGTAVASERLAHINHAYAVLSNPDKRRRYDDEQGLAQSGVDRRGRTAQPAASTSPVASAQPTSRAFVFRPLT